MTSKGLTAPFPAHRLEPSAWGAAAIREIDSFSGERNPELYGQGLLALAQRLLRQNRLEPALQLLQHLKQSQPEASAVALKAGLEIDAIEGRGAIGQRVEFSLGRFSREAMNPALLVGMGTAATAFQVSRAALLGRLLSSPVASLATRGFGARALAGTTAFALEAPAFVAATHGAQAVFGQRPSQPVSLGKELAGAFLTLGALKLMGWAGEGTLRLGGESRLARAAVPQLSAYLGLLAGHGLEHWSGLRKISSGDTWLLDSLITLAQFRVGGELSNQLLGRRFLNFQSELSRAAETSAPTPQLPGFGHDGHLATAAGIVGGARRISELDSQQPFAMSSNRRSGFWHNDGVAPSPSTLKIRWVPEGTPRLQIPASNDPVGTILGVLETHLKKIHPTPIEIHYQGRMIVIRDQDKLKERIAKLFESPAIPNGFLAAVAFLEGSPKMALIFIKDKGGLDYKFTGIHVPDPSASSPFLGTAASLTAGSSTLRSFHQAEELKAQVPELLQSRNPKVAFEGYFGIRDNMSLSQVLERPGGLPSDQTFTVVMRDKAVQIVFAWETDGGVRKVGSKTLPIESSFLNLSSASGSATTTPTPRTPAVTESRERISDPERRTPVPAETAELKTIPCADNRATLEKFHELISAPETHSLLNPTIEMRSGSLSESDLAFIAEMLTSNPLPKGRKITMVWVERPQGLLRLESDEQGKITAELRTFGQPIQNYLLKPNFSGGEKIEMRFVRRR